MKKILFSLLLLSTFAMANDYTRDNVNSVVVDNSTNLMWQDDANAKTLTKTWSDAITYCEDLNMAGHDDWRLPNFNELQSVVDYTRYNPAMDPAFTNVASSQYWTSTTSKYDTNYAHYIDFLYGKMDNNPAGYKNATTVFNFFFNMTVNASTFNFRCVRDN